MKTLKESILNRSNHGAKGFEAQRREMIENWLKKYNIKNYTINDDFTIDVNGNVNLFKRDLVEFPDYIQFGIVKGNFNCDNNQLTSLEGAPRKVGGDFDCHKNNLTSLEGAPEKVRGGLYCDNNQLTSLEGAPKEVREYFDCRNNKVRFTEEDIRRVCEVGDKIIVA